MKRLHVAVSPLTNRIFAGSVLKDGKTWAANKTDVTGEACAAVAMHVMGCGAPVVVTENGVPRWEITVRELQPWAAMTESGNSPEHHFAGAGKPITGGNGAVQGAQDEALLRQALEALLGQRGEPDWHTGKQRENAIAAQQPAARPPKPTECMNGCPDRQVCDHCQWPPGPDTHPCAAKYHAHSKQGDEQ